MIQFCLAKNISHGAQRVLYAFRCAEVLATVSGQFKGAEQNLPTYVFLNNCEKFQIRDFKSHAITTN